MSRDPDMQHLLLEHLSSGTRCVIHTPPGATGERCGHEIGIACWYLTLTNKTRKRLQAWDAQQIAERNYLDRQLQAPAAAGERLRDKNVPTKYQFIIATSISPPPSFHNNNNKWFLHYFAISCCTEQAPLPRSESSCKRWQAWFLCFVLQTSERTCRAIIRAGSYQQAFHLLKPHTDTCLFIATALHHSFKHISICE